MKDQEGELMNAEQRCHYCGFFLPGHYDNCPTVKPTWRTEELPLPVDESALLIGGE